MDLSGACYVSQCYLQEVLAGTDESQLSAGTVRLRLAASDSLDQLRDLLCHHLMSHTDNTQPYIKNITVDCFLHTLYLPLSFQV